MTRGAGQRRSAARRLALAMAAAALGCSGGGAPAAGGGDTSGAGGSGGPPALAKKVVLALEILPGAGPDEIDAGGAERIELVQTDETGSTERSDLGTYPGPCRDVSAELAGAPMDPLLGIVCTGGEGLRLRLVRHGTDLVVLRALGATGDDLDFDEIRRIPLPPGAAVTTAPTTTPSSSPAPAPAPPP